MKNHKTKMINSNCIPIFIISYNHRKFTNFQIKKLYSLKSEVSCDQNVMVEFGKWVLDSDIYNFMLYLLKQYKILNMYFFLQMSDKSEPLGR